MTPTGSGACYLTQPSYTARLDYVSGGAIQLDSIMSYNFLSTAPSTWGGVKSLYE